MVKIGIFLSVIAILVFAAAAIILVVRREKGKKKIRRMTQQDKTFLINELVKPFGCFYADGQGVFSSGPDTWQRMMGYRVQFDRRAQMAGVVTAFRRIYFEYEGRTWLIAFRKGQYGICTGAEVGVYHADRIVFPKDFESVRFEAVTDRELPCIKTKLADGRGTLYELETENWRLAGFIPGKFSFSRKLRMYNVLVFRDRDMAEAFLEGMDESVVARNYYSKSGSEVYVNLLGDGESTYAEQPGRVWAQVRNLLRTWLFRVFTIPFESPGDRMLFLYFQFPYHFRRALLPGLDYYIVLPAG